MAIDIIGWPLADPGDELRQVWVLAQRVKGRKLCCQLALRQKCVDGPVTNKMQRHRQFPAMAAWNKVMLVDGRARDERAAAERAE
jgi:hypothetical protein